jgi:hypothetical protein
LQIDFVDHNVVVALVVVRRHGDAPGSGGWHLLDENVVVRAVFVRVVVAAVVVVAIVAVVVVGTSRGSSSGISVRSPGAVGAVPRVPTFALRGG